MGVSPKKGFWSRFRQRFSGFQIFVLIGGTIMIAWALVLLGTLWEYTNRESTSSRQHEQSIWSDLILSGYLSQFVTICSAILRICIAVQLLPICMMLASLALESRQVREKDIGITFIHQYANSGPFGVGWRFMMTAKSAKRMLGFIVVVLLTFESVFVQFSSTILLGDLQVIQLREGFDTVTNVNYTFGTWAPGDDLNLLSAVPIQFPAFAEKSGARTTVTGGKSPGIVDSGSVIRALLPLRELASLASYRGPVSAVSTHAVCFAPRFSEASAQFQRLPPLGPQIAGLIQPPIETVNFLAELGDMDEGSANRKLFERSSLELSGINFDFSAINCTLTANTTSICDVSDSINRHIGTPRAINDFPASKISDIGLHWLLVSNSTWTNTTALPTSRVRRTGNEAFDGTEWATQSFPSQDLRIRHSLCAISFKWAAGTVDVDVRYNCSEPRLYRNPPEADGSWEFDTTAVQLQLGTNSPTRLSKERRGILDLSDFALNKSQTIQSIGWSLRLQYNRAGYGTTIPGAPTGETRLLEPTIATLFLNSYYDTRQLSLAWEAAMMTSFTTFYYHLLDFLVLPGTATTRLFKSYAVPRKFLGLFLVCGNSALHFLLVAVVLWAFFRSDSWKQGIPDPEELGYFAAQTRGRRDREDDEVELRARGAKKRNTMDEYLAVDSGEE